MKLVCMTQVYNQNTLIGPDGKTNIERFINSVSQYCDGLVIFDDGSTDGTRDVITSLSGDFELEIPSNVINTPERESYHRARSLEHCKRMNADWVLALDVDEVFEKRGEQGGIRAMLKSVSKDIMAVGFYKRELWRSDRYIRVDEDWAHRIEVRAFKLSNSENGHYDWKYNIEPAYRTQLVPYNLPEPYSKSLLKILHYAYINDLSILEKYNRWRSLGIDISNELNDKRLRLVDADAKLFDSSWPHGPGIEAYDMQVCRMLP